MILLFDDEVKKVICNPGIYYLKLYGKDYVGSSKCLRDRLLEHRQKLLSNKHENIWMQRIFNKYSKDNCFVSILEILDKNADYKEIYKCEKKWIDTLNPLLNLKLDPTTQNNSLSQSKIVYQYTLDGKLINKFSSTKEAERQLNKIISSSQISACCRGKLLQSGGYYWSYIPLLNYQYALERSKWKWKAIVLKNIITGETKIFNNIALAAKSIIKPGDNFASISASLSGIAKRGRGLVKKTYTCYYLNSNEVASLKSDKLLESL
jgi:hypothetical protein